MCSGFPVLVKPSESEKNYAALAEAAGGSASSAANERRVYLGDLAPSLTEADLRLVAEAIGALDKVVIMRDGDGASKGIAVVTFSAKEAADRAITALHGIEIAGRRVKVRRAARRELRAGPPAVKQHTRCISPPPPPLTRHSPQAGRLNGLGEVESPDGSRFSLDAAHASSLTPQARALLAQKLAGATSHATQALGSSLLAATSAAFAGLASSAVAAAALPPPPPPVTPCVLIRNVFNPVEESARGDAVRAGAGRPRRRHAHALDDHRRHRRMPSSPPLPARAGLGREPARRD